MKTTKTQDILGYLKRGNTLTKMEAVGMFRVVCLGGIMSQLRKQGHEIVTIMHNNKRTGERYAAYRLITQRPNIFARITNAFRGEK